jgi:hypothetical protein
MPKLIIKSQTPTAGSPGHYHVYLQSDSGAEVRQQLVGFSYFGEVGGLRMIPASKYVVLDQYNGSSDWTQAVSCASDSTVIRMSYEQWFDMLASHGINFSRIFVYPEPEPACYLFDRPDGTHYDLNAPGSLYLTLLQRYIIYAQKRNIIVQISLAGIQTLRPAQWAYHPMNANSTKPNNINGYLRTNDGRTKFCVIQEPVGAVDTEPELNYQTQSKALDWILNASSWAWNVVYELFNEPGGTDIPLVDQINWLVTTANWLDTRLRDPATGGHTHLITLNSGPALLAADGNNILKRMLFDAQGNRRLHPLIDVFSFHGTDWGGDRGSSTRPDANGNPPWTSDMIREVMRNTVNSFYSMPIDMAGNKVQGSPVALIFDSDAQYRAQDSPETYGRVVLQDLKLDYNHRWSDFWLSQSRLCRQVNGIQKALLVKP